MRWGMLDSCYIYIYMGMDFRNGRNIAVKSIDHAKLIGGSWQDDERIIYRIMQ